MRGCAIAVVTHFGGFGGSPIGFGGTYLVVTILWKGVFNSQFNSIFALMSTTIDFLAPRLTSIVLKLL